jgi:ubiquinone/menaquinone biosynthesis C-methylase UbiE
MQRLNMVHWAMRELWQSSVRVPIANPARVLDVGCGSGIWAKEIAEVLPRTQFIGVDLSPTIIADQPDNLSFQVYHLND